MSAAGYNKTAKELLEMGEQGRIKPVLNQYWPQIVGVFFGVSTGMVINFGTRRPYFSGISKHLIFTVGYVGVLMFFQNQRDEYYAEKDAVFRHYIKLHPEDFPDPERKKIADLLEPWIPIR